MSAEIPPQRPIPPLERFLRSPIFDSHLLSNLVIKFAGDQTMAMFLNAIHLHPDFQGLVKLRKAHQIIAKKSSSRLIRKIKSTIDTSIVLRTAVNEQNPFLLVYLLNYKNRYFSLYNLNDAILDLAAQGNTKDLLRIYKAHRVSDQHHWMAVDRAVQRGHLDVVSTLLDPALPLSCKPSFPFIKNSPYQLGLLLNLTFEAHNWKQMFPLILSKIPDAQGKRPLFLCALRLTNKPAIQMRFFIEQTKASTLFSKWDWDLILDLSVEARSIEIVHLLAHPDSPISLSSKAHLKALRFAVMYQDWSLVESLISSDPTFNSLNFMEEITFSLLHLCYSPGQLNVESQRLGKFYKDYLDKYSHRFRERSPTESYCYPREVVELALKWECFHILKIYLESPAEMERFVYEKGRKKYLISNRFLKELLKKCEERNLIELKIEVEKELGRRIYYPFSLESED